MPTAELAPRRPLGREKSRFSVRSARTKAEEGNDGRFLGYAVDDHLTQFAPNVSTLAKLTLPGAQRTASGNVATLSCACILHD